MNPKEISKQFDRAVVLVASDDRSGSGFIVGSKGYAITCAHVVGDAPEVKVTFAAPGKDGKASTATATVVAADSYRDIAC